MAKNRRVQNMKYKGQAGNPTQPSKGNGNVSPSEVGKVVAAVARSGVARRKAKPSLAASIRGRVAGAVKAGSSAARASVAKVFAKFRSK